MNGLELDDEFDFYWDEDARNFSIIGGVDYLEQVVQIILKTFEGEHAFYPEFGAQMQEIIGYNVADSYIKYVITKAIERDTRFDSVSDFIITREQDHKVTVEFHAKLAASEGVNGGVIGGFITW